MDVCCSGDDDKSSPTEVRLDDDPGDVVPGMKKLVVTEVSDFLGWWAWYGNVFGSRSIEWMDESSLLSDCTSGLVGCL